VIPTVQEPVRSSVRRGVELAHPDLEAAIDAYLRARGWSWRQLQAGECTAGGVAIGIDELQVYLIDADPVLWAECNLLDKEKGDGTPWRFFDYQKAGARYLGDVIFECAAEVGKTRNIVAVSLWMFFGKGPRPRGSQLIAGALDGNLEDIYDEQDWQLTANPHLHARVNWDKSKVKPYRKLVSIEGNQIDYRPAGNDGKAFRGVHAGLAGHLDEAAKLHERKTWGEFWRALKPWAIAALYSVPDGVTKSEFFRLCRRARALDPLAPAQRLPGIALETPDEQAAALAGRERSFVKFRWPKALMPPPFWTDERRRGYIEQFGGEETSEYQQNVLGNWGDPASTLFPWSRFAPCLRYIPEYHELELTWSDGEATVSAVARRLNPSYEPTARPGDEDEAALSVVPMLEVLEEQLDVAALGDFDQIEELIARVFAPLPNRHLVGGIDCGSAGDVTEILLFERLGRRRRCVARLQLKRFPYDRQRTMIRALDELFEPSLGWGLEATGVGTALQHFLVEGEGDWTLADRLTGFIANANVPDVDPATGEPVVDERTGKARQISAKEFGTILLERLVQRVDLELPATRVMLEQWPQYKSRKTPSGGRAFDNTNDHAIDATRVAIHRDHEMEHGDGADVPIAYAVPPGMSRPDFEGGRSRGDWP
jgi:hypothetical protein